MAAWMEEVFADIVGVLLAGPSYAIAFPRFLCAFFSLDTASPTHPPIALRIELICELVETERYDQKLVASGAALLRDWRAEAARVTSFRVARPEISTILALLVRDIRAQYPLLLGAARAAVGARAYDPSHVERDVERGMWMFQFGLPAIDVDTTGLSSSIDPLPPARVFSSAWMAYLQLLETASELPAVSQHSGRIAEVLLGSLDGADAARAWVRAQ